MRTLPATGKRKHCFSESIGTLTLLSLAAAASPESTDVTTSAVATSPSASTLLSATSPDVFFIRTSSPAALESPSLRTVEPAAVPRDSASTTGAATSALGRRQQMVDRVFGQLTDRLSYARSRASRLRATEEVVDLALAELFATRPWNA